MQCDGAKDLTGDLVVEPIMEKSFDAFRKILREQKLDSYFRESCFGQYLDLPEDNNARFQMKMVYDLLKHRDCGPFVAAYAEYLSDELQVPNNGLDTGLLRKTYASLLWKYGEVKAQKPYATDVKDPRLPKPNSLAPDEEQLVHID
ncbi:hypothetical protein T459_15992 [Capsicum annuum]|uniref:Uncharacterized protein n=1 Tax=Capsicum annuum TaxID=4072 RepID=A0A2G2Z7G0_CAPAN|nr:hypothetical protein T459_15992 [Capsicum annuum]